MSSTGDFQNEIILLEKRPGISYRLMSSIQLKDICGGYTHTKENPKVIFKERYLYIKKNDPMEDF